MCTQGGIAGSALRPQLPPQRTAGLPRRALSAAAAAAAGVCAGAAPAAAADAREAPTCRVASPPRGLVARCAPDVAPAFRTYKRRRSGGGGGFARGGGGGGSWGGGGGSYGGGGGGNWGDWGASDASGAGDELGLWHTLCALSLAMTLHHCALRCLVRAPNLCWGLLALPLVPTPARRALALTAPRPAQSLGGAAPCLASCSAAVAAL